MVFLWRNWTLTPLIPQVRTVVRESIYNGSGRTWNGYWLAFALKLEGKAS
jgi:hypothetical protein